MGLELFNKTSRIKDVPKFNYNGKIRLWPGKSYPIRDYMITFYKPYERIGVIVRNSLSSEVKVEPEVKKILDVIEDEKKLNEAEDAVIKSLIDYGKEETKEETKEVDVVESTAQEGIEGKKPITYTKETLDEMKMVDLKQLMEDHGIPVPDKYKKDEYVKAIISFQNK